MGELPSGRTTFTVCTAPAENGGCRYPRTWPRPGRGLEDLPTPAPRHVGPPAQNGIDVTSHDSIKRSRRPDARLQHRRLVPDASPGPDYSPGPRYSPGPSPYPWYSPEPSPDSRPPPLWDNPSCDTDIPDVCTLDGECGYIYQYLFPELPQVDCSNVPEMCTGACRDYSYCVDPSTGQPGSQYDDDCANAPSDCGQVCGPYVQCLGSGSGSGSAPTRAAASVATTAAAAGGSGRRTAPATTRAAATRAAPATTRAAAPNGRPPADGQQRQHENRRLNGRHDPALRRPSTPPPGRAPRSLPTSAARARRTRSAPTCTRAASCRRTLFRCTLSSRTSTMSRASCRTGIRCRGRSTRSLPGTRRSTSSITSRIRASLGPSRSRRSRR